MDIDYSQVPNATFEIDPDALSKAIIILNSMSPYDAVAMSRSGKVYAGYYTDPDLLCILIPAPRLARQLTADGLSSYSGKELKAWADAYEKEPLQQIVNAAMQKWLDGVKSLEELKPLLLSYPHVSAVETGEDGRVNLVPEEGEAIPTEAQTLADAWGI